MLITSMTLMASFKALLGLPLQLVQSSDLSLPGLSPTGLVVETRSGLPVSGGSLEPPFKVRCFMLASSDPYSALCSVTTLAIDDYPLRNSLGH
jgi:hypothetical protein